MVDNITSIVNNYDWKITLKKGLKYLAFYGLPALITYLINMPQMSSVMSLSVGSILVIIANWLKQHQITITEKVK